MATTFHFVVSCEPTRESAASAVLYESHRLVGRLERELSEFLPSSPVFRLNHSPPGTRVRFSEHGFYLLKRSLELAERTSDAFNPLAKSRAAQPKLAWNTSTLEVWSEVAHVHLGFGAIGKGYALDKVRALVEAGGFQNYLLSGGGSSVVLSGFAFPSEPWRWGWSWEKRDGDPLGVRFEHCSGAPIAIGISGTQEQGEHIISASASAKRTQSALYAGESACEADAFSTALYVSGWENQTTLCNPVRNAPALGLLGTDGTLYWNEAFEKLWGPAA